jgi:hypothetical protein
MTAAEYSIETHNVGTFANANVPNWVRKYVKNRKATSYLSQPVSYCVCESSHMILKTEALSRTNQQHWKLRVRRFE